MKQRKTKSIEIEIGVSCRFYDIKVASKINESTKSIPTSSDAKPKKQIRQVFVADRKYLLRAWFLRCALRNGPFLRPNRILCVQYARTAARRDTQRQARLGFG